MTCCRNGCQSTDSFKNLLKFHGKHIDSNDAHYRSFLYLACDDSHLPCVSLLINCGADVSICDDDGWTPLYDSCEKKGYHNIASLLLSNHAQVDKFDNDGCMLLLRKGTWSVSWD